MINPTQSATTVSQVTASTPQTTSLTSDFETFLLMLTTQAQNQDPLEPMDSSQYASQLAQFSMVEQQVQTNTLLSTLSSVIGTTDLGELASWVGMDVRNAAGFYFDGAPVTLFAEPDPAAEQTVLVIRDAQDRVIDRKDVAAGETQLFWAGTDLAGSSMAAGTFSAQLESYKGDELLSTSPVSAYSRVVEAQVGGDTVLLTLEGGQVIPAAQVTAVRAGG